MSINFISNICWLENRIVLPAEKFRVKLPPGLAISNVRQPIFVDVAGMQRSLRQNVARGSQGGQLGIVNGLVTKAIKVRFENVERQWRCTPQGGPSSRQGPGKFQFQGGCIFIDVLLGVLVLNTNQPNEQDPISIDIFSAVYSHELLHVADEIDIVKNWILPKLSAAPLIARYLVKAEPFVFGTQAQSIFQIEQEFRPFIQNKIEAEVHDIWAEESNRRESRRDAPAEYKIVQDRIGDLRAQQVNRP